MSLILVPKHDLLFKANSMVKVGDVKKENHLRGPKGEKIAEPEEKKPFTNLRLHVCGSDKKIQEKFESMAQAILDEDWISFDTLFFELKEFKPSKTCLNTFGREQIRITIARNPSNFELETIRRKLNSIGISEEVMDQGYEDGFGFLQSQCHK